MVKRPFFLSTPETSTLNHFIDVCGDRPTSLKMQSSPGASPAQEPVQQDTFNQNCRLDYVVYSQHLFSISAMLMQYIDYPIDRPLNQGSLDGFFYVSTDISPRPQVSIGFGDCCTSSTAKAREKKLQIALFTCRAWHHIMCTGTRARHETRHERALQQSSFLSRGKRSLTFGPFALTG